MKKIFFILALSLPSITLAVDFREIVNRIIDQASILPGFIIGLAVVYFIYNVFLYIQSGSNPKQAEEATKMITYSIVFIFVMISVWGLVNILVGTFDLDSRPIPIPEIPTTN